MPGTVLDANDTGMNKRGDILRPPEACTLVGQGDNKKEVNKNIQYNLKWIYVLQVRIEQSKGIERDGL